MRLNEYFFTEKEEDGPPEMDTPYIANIKDKIILKMLLVSSSFRP